MLCVLIIYLSGGANSSISTSNDKFFEKLLSAISITLFLYFILMSSLGSNLLDYGDIILATEFFISFSGLVSVHSYTISFRIFRWTLFYTGIESVTLWLSTILKNFENCLLTPCEPSSRQFYGPFISSRCFISSPTCFEWSLIDKTDFELNFSKAN